MPRGTLSLVWKHWRSDMPAIKTPELESQWRIGDVDVFVFDIEEDAKEYGEYGYSRNGRTTVICHDDDGNEVEVTFYPREEDDE